MSLRVSIETNQCFTLIITYTHMSADAQHFHGRSSRPRGVDSLQVPGQADPSLAQPSAGPQSTATGDLHINMPQIDILDKENEASFRFQASSGQNAQSLYASSTSQTQGPVTNMSVQAHHQDTSGGVNQTGTGAHSRSGTGIQHQDARGQGRGNSGTAGMSSGQFSSGAPGAGPIPTGAGGPSGTSGLTRAPTLDTEFMKKYVSWLAGHVLEVCI